MTIDHLAIWCKDLESMRQFYMKYFRCISNEKYINEFKHFASYFLKFDDGCRIELMSRTDIVDGGVNKNSSFGIAHFAINVGSEAAVDALCAKLRADGVVIASEPRHTGDGYYECGIFDFEGNYIELTT